MFIYFRLSAWFAAVGPGPPQPCRQSSVCPVYLRVKVRIMADIWSMSATNGITPLTISYAKLVAASEFAFVYT